MKRKSFRSTLSRSFPSTLPERRFMSHKYATNVQLSSSGGASVGWRFRVNAMYDPDQTGSGHQPLMFDQMYQLYEVYTVLYSHIVVQFCCPDDTTPVNVVLFQNADLTTPDVDIMREQPGVRYAMLPGGNGDMKRLSRWFSSKKTFGGDTVDNPDLSGNSGFDPVTQQYHEISIKPVDGSTTIPAFRCAVFITYYAVWSRRLEVSPS